MPVRLAMRTSAMRALCSSRASVGNVTAFAAQVDLVGLILAEGKNFEISFSEKCVTKKSGT